MTLNVRLEGAIEQAARLRGAERAIGRIEAEAVNEIAGEARKDELLKPLREASGLPSTELTRRVKLVRASAGNPIAKITADSAGIPATRFKFSIQAMDRTRGRVFVPWVGGSKLVAGFANPAGRYQLPLRTFNRKVGNRGKVYTYAIKRQYSELGKDDLDIALAPVSRGWCGTRSVSTRLASRTASPRRWRGAWSKS
ncbi:hypothetical protein [Chitinimonas koreensis]|uniref:hypothetical protein n=1 Tax=Chitinimonas koreensis TaxID=356302 RepID=UPI0016545FCC|nr:hypothetical protein [Chitinimonas koreensis]QNM94903.1 hypothetical protein H9L41_13325 [Chitinimonas koreensis]